MQESPHGAGRRRWIAATLTTGTWAALPGSLRAQAYPSRPLQFVVASTPGGILDTIGRLVAKGLESLGQPVVVQNVGGAGGTLGTAVVASAAADGQTVGMVSTSHAINPAVYAKLPFDTRRDLQPLSQAVNLINVLVVHPSVPATSLAAFVDLGKRRDRPLTFGSAGTGQSNHLSAQMLSTLAAMPIMHVPYKGSAAAMVDVMAGTIDAMFVDVLSSTPQIQAGRLRPLAISSTMRQPVLPDVPTFAESGFAAFNANSWLGVVTRAGTPMPIVTRLGETISATMNARETRARLIAMGVQPVGSAPAEFARFLDGEYARYAAAVRQAGITPQ